MNINPNLRKDNTFKIYGYICEIADYNQDNPNESIVYIYESKENLEDGDYLEQISLLNVNIKEVLKEYIYDTYVKKNIESEKSYFAFVLGYDVLNEMLRKSNIPECDLSYDFCNELAIKFLKSEEYVNPRYSGYEMLCEWVDKNEDYIKQKLSIKDFKKVKKNKERER